MRYPTFHLTFRCRSNGFSALIYFIFLFWKQKIIKRYKISKRNMKSTLADILHIVILKVNTSEDWWKRLEDAHTTTKTLLS